MNATASRSVPGHWRAAALWLAAAGLSVWTLATQVDLLALKATLRASYPGWLLAALLGVVATVVLRVARWRVLLMAAPRSYPAWAPVWRATLWAQGLNMLLPWRAGDWTRAYGVRRVCQGSAAYALGTIAAEKLLDLACLSAAALLVLHFRKLPDPAVLQPTWRVWAPFLLLSGTLVLAWPLGRAASHYSQDWPGWWRAIIGSGQRLVTGLTMLARPGVLAPALAWSALLWVGHAFNNYATARALGVPMDWPGALLVLVVLQAGLAPASTPAKIGVFQALCVASLSLLGQAAPVGLAYGLALQLVVMLPPLALLLANLTLKERGDREGRGRTD